MLLYCAVIFVYVVPIKVEGLDLRKTENALQHNTALYEGDQAVLRRGARFLVRFTLNQELDRDKHSLNIEFRRGASASFQRGTRFECVVGRRAVREWEWQGTVEGAVGRTVDAAVEIPVNAPVGEYEVIAEAVDEASGRQDSFTVDQKVVILFNPWNNSECVKPHHILCSMVLAASIYFTCFVCSTWCILMGGSRAFHRVGFSWVVLCDVWTFV